jgi:DNA-binding HxlR family transcriptional regulator
MHGARSFNEIHRGVPLMSRALLVQRLRQLEDDGIIEREPRKDGRGHDYHLTPAGDDLRPLIEMLGRWGLTYGRQRLQESDRDSTILMWGLRRRIIRENLPPRRIVIRFELTGVARSRTSVRLHWLVLERSGVDVCLKDPGYPVDITIACDVSILIAVYLGYTSWEQASRHGMRVTAERSIRPHVASWLRLDQMLGRDIPIVPPAA